MVLMEEGLGRNMFRKTSRQASVRTSPSVHNWYGHYCHVIVYISFSKNQLYISDQMVQWLSERVVCTLYPEATVTDGLFINMVITNL